MLELEEKALVSLAKVGTIFFFFLSCFLIFFSYKYSLDNIIMHNLRISIGVVLYTKKNTFDWL